MVHERKHACQTITRFPDEITHRTAGFTEAHYTGWTGMNAQFLFRRDHSQVIPLPEGAILIYQELRHEKQRQAFVAWRCVYHRCQYNMNDILSHIVLTPGNVDLLASQQIMVTFRLSSSLERRQV